MDNPAPIGPPESIAVKGIELDEFTREFAPLAPQAANTIEGINFDENGVLTGIYQIPPDPIAVAGADHLVSVVNSSIMVHLAQAGSLDVLVFVGEV